MNGQLRNFHCENGKQIAGKTLIQLQDLKKDDFTQHQTNKHKTSKCNKRASHAIKKKLLTT